MSSSELEFSASLFRGAPDDGKGATFATHGIIIEQPLDANSGRPIHVCVKAGVPGTCVDDL